MIFHTLLTLQNLENDVPHYFPDFLKITMIIIWKRQQKDVKKTKKQMMQIYKYRG